MRISNSLKTETRSLKKDVARTRDMWTDVFIEMIGTLVDSDKTLTDNLDAVEDAAEIAEKAIKVWEGRWK